MFLRTQTRSLRVGNLAVGGGAPVSVQSMCTPVSFSASTAVGFSLKSLRSWQVSSMRGSHTVRVRVPGSQISEPVSKSDAPAMYREIE